MKVKPFQYITFVLENNLLESLGEKIVEENMLKGEKIELKKGRKRLMTHV